MAVFISQHIEVDGGCIASGHDGRVILRHDPAATDADMAALPYNGRSTGEGFNIYKPLDIDGIIVSINLFRCKFIRRFPAIIGNGPVIQFIGGGSNTATHDYRMFRCIVIINNQMVPILCILITGHPDAAAIVIIGIGIQCDFTGVINGNRTFTNYQNRITGPVGL